MKKTIAVVALSLAALNAAAERADAQKQAAIEFDQAHIDEVTQIRTLTGRVVLTRGTLTVKSDKAVLKESPEGYMVLTLTAAPGKVATFRQKRDGGPNLWVEGQAQRIEYDERTELVKLFSDATVRQLENGRLSSEVNGAFISYDNRTEQANVGGNAGGQSQPGQGRNTLILAPRRGAAAPAATPAPAAGNPAESSSSSGKQ
ncbi:lipopolysaccharide transport periplasmic protein LptA [Herbaspirillum sp. SJZ107]|uniref:lipopolysaccharide transport periplasmic protein LptA n=1 Tax=Herbaspirillum sp. SJZ107 TaxID=2572881 RepID=UPI00114E8FDB|nr:lipopolysaccharide transport periplasmic protein LptA [Herbaspirillum sp. SJZ107]TQK04916.1 lipopolysaccharide export system protein LptA [Herbaspirillum sp. SJZ107]